jgi:hypothetical protein
MFRATPAFEQTPKEKSSEIVKQVHLNLMKDTADALKIVASSRPDGILGLIRDALASRKGSAVHSEVTILALRLTDDQAREFAEYGRHLPIAASVALELFAAKHDAHQKIRNIFPIAQAMLPSVSRSHRLQQKPTSRRSVSPCWRTVTGAPNQPRKAAVSVTIAALLTTAVPALKTGTLHRSSSEPKMTITTLSKGLMVRALA